MSEHLISADIWNGLKAMLDDINDEAGETERNDIGHLIATYGRAERFPHIDWPLFNPEDIE